MMLPENVQQKLIDEIELFITYGVVAEEQQAATDLVRKYCNNPLALAALQEFYKVLPEAREEAVSRIAFIDAVQGVTLLALSTVNHAYVALVSESEAHIVGEYGRDEVPDEVLAFFGYTDTEQLYESFGKVAEMPELSAEETSSVCPVCQVAAGEYHLLGCPVEICPWCDGQLNKCHCRFEKLEVESLDSDEQVEAFRELLEEHGRVAYKPEQKVGYPGTSKGLDRPA